jgi:anhydro-N-acetylmuramic acid kinase
MRVVGLMSGTSYDAIDVAAAEFALLGDTLWLSPLGAFDVPYSPGLREAIADALPPRPVTAERICRLDTGLGVAFAEAAAHGLERLCGGTADLVVSHGQTIFHWVDSGEDTEIGTAGPRDGGPRHGGEQVSGQPHASGRRGGQVQARGRRARGTLQLGQPAWIAERTGLPVVSDLRSADIARGGQGAPLVPVFDALLLAPPAPGERPRAALNLGGIANMTVVRAGAPTIGYDVGPGNALIDAAMVELYGKPYDAGGIEAASGRVHTGLLRALLAEPYYAAAPPKSTGKELFHWAYIASRLARLGVTLAPADVVATVTELTARVVAAECARHDVAEVIASGGGTNNSVLMGRLTELTGHHCAIRTTESHGIPPAAKEAYAFTVLGWLTWHGLPGALPSVTGARSAAVLGSITPGRTPLRLPPHIDAPPRRLRIGPLQFQA